MMKDPTKTVLTVTAENAGERIDSFVSAADERLTRSSAVRLIESGALTVNCKSIAKNYRVREGDVIAFDIPEPEPYEVKPEQKELDIVYEDDDIIVVNKPEGMVVHPAAGNTDGTLVNALLYHCKDSLSGIGGVKRPGIVHRIDKDTSGLLVVAKNDEAHLFLSEQLKKHDISRVYYAVAVGNIRNDKGMIDAPIGRNPIDRKKMAVICDPDKHSRNAVTHYEVIERFQGYTLLRCVLETGRTHQIRVHLAYIGHPLLGDEVYGHKNDFALKHKALIHGQCLHAKELTLTHPRSGEKMHFSCELPENMRKILQILRNQ